MRCPYCGSYDSQVKDSRPIEDEAAIRRRRICSTCHARFTTFERTQLRDLIVRKSDGRTQTFDREKLLRSLDVALRKRPVERERIEHEVTGLHRRLETEYEGEICSKQIGGMVLEMLMRLDPVAYVRYASVYKDFKNVEDFASLMQDLPKA